MIRSDPVNNIKDLAGFLIEKKSKGQRVNLFLGHKTGALFTDDLYRVLRERYEIPKQFYGLIKSEISETNEPLKYFQYIEAIENTSVTQKNSEIYRFLGRYFNQSAIHTILKDAVDLSYPNDIFTRSHLSLETDLLAELIRANFFETIFITNIDTLLEQSLENRGLETSEDYQVIIVGEKSSESFKPKDEETLIIKIFGDLTSLKYKTVGNEFKLENADRSLRQVLKEQLEKDTIVLGYDALWDRPLERAFSDKGGTVWYVNEEPLDTYSYLSYVLDQRDTREIVGPEGKYRYFLQALYNSIGGEASLSPLPSLRKNVFISYDPKDERYFKQLVTHLKGFLPLESERRYRPEIWDRTRIEAGRDSQKEICKALEETKLAVFLVSSDFLASESISKYEITPLLQAARNREVLLVSVVLNHCAYSHSELAKYQPRDIDMTKPLLEMSRTRRGKAWMQVAEYIDKILNEQI